jgi:WD40 repeat protein
MTPPKCCNSVQSVAFSPNGKRIVSGSAGGAGSQGNAVEMWDAGTGKPIWGPMTGHGAWVDSVAFSADGKHIVSGDQSGEVRLWDADTGQPIGDPLTGHQESVNSVAFSRDGMRIVSVSDDHTIRLWPGLAVWPTLLCAKLTANMSHEQWRDWVAPDIDYIQVCPNVPVAPD